MNPRLRKHFSNFKQRFEITIPESLPEKEKILLESQAFEKFVNNTIFTLDYPDIFTADISLLNFISIGGGNDTGIDGIGIKVNDKIVRNIEDIKEILKEKNKRIEYDFIFIQSKMQEKFDTSEFLTFAQGIENFLLKKGFLPENDKLKEFRIIKNFLDTDEVNDRIRRTPNLYLYYVSAGNPPTDQHFLGTKESLEKKFSEDGYYFDEVKISLIDGKTLINFCDELENNFQVKINYLDSIPLLTGNNEDIKKAYTFTCTAEEYLKILTKEDDTLRRHLFNDNVRDYLDSKKDGSVNSEIEKSITDSPDMFLLCNNGVTIVCSDFTNIKDKLVQIDNPQIVNGCQTSNSIFKHRTNPNIKDVKLLVRLICTENSVISNKIVRGTNKQNQVLDEDFETTRPYHQDFLEPFFLAIDSEPRLYYERRNKQYNGTSLPRPKIINLAVLCESFTSIFLNAPHDAYKHKKIILDIYGGEIYKRKIFRDEHSEYLYYTSAAIWYSFEKSINNQPLSELKPFKWHLYLIFRLIIGEELPKLNKGYKIENYCKKLIENLKEGNFEKNLAIVISTFQEIKVEWTKLGKSQYGIKDNKEFTDLLINYCNKKFSKKVETKEIIKEETEPTYKGTIINIILKENNLWFGFIESPDFPQNVYFDAHSYKGKYEQLRPKHKVEFSLLHIKKDRVTAKNVELDNKKYA